MSEKAHVIFLAALLSAPLLFGTVEVWSLAVMETLSFGLAAFFLLKNMKGKEPFLYKTPGLTPLLIFVFFMLFQLIPLPPAALKAISPAAYETYARAGWGEGGWVPISLNKKAALMEFFRLAAYVCFYFLTVQMLAEKGRLKRTVAAISVFASALSLFAILQHITSNGKIYWLRGLADAAGTPFGPYVNRNHYAGLMEMLFPVVLGMFLYYMPPARYGPLRARLSEFIGRRRSGIHLILGLSSVLIATSVFLSLSRGGIMSLGLSMVLFGALLFKSGASLKRGLLVVSIIAVTIFSVGWFGWVPIMERFEDAAHPEFQAYDERRTIWKDSAEMAGDYLASGAGFGSFKSLYPSYRTLTDDTRAVEHAHNDYIEIASGGGLTALFLALWFAGAVLLRFWRAFSKRREPYSIHLSIGCAAGLFSIALHGLTDFNLHIGANGLFFFFLAGLMVSASHTRLQEGLKETLLEKRPLPAPKAVFAAAVSVLILSVVFNSGILIGNRLFSSGDYRSASLFDPLEAKYRYFSAASAGNSPEAGPRASNFRKALWLEPSNGSYLQGFGLYMNSGGNAEKGDGLLEAGVKADKTNPARYRTYALWLFGRGEKEKGIENTRKAIELEPKKTRQYIALMTLDGLTDGEIERALPDRVEPRLNFADYLSEIHREENAEAAYLSALDYTKNERKPAPAHFFKAYQFFRKRGKHDEALAVMKKAVEAIPEDAQIRLKAAEAYEAVRITYRAAEEYEKALILDPRNETARKRLDALGKRP